jgi:crossover junction endodeoxyribonuclease RuvC
MIILSVDQGIAHFGYAVLDISNNKTNLITYGCFLSTIKKKHPVTQQRRMFELMSKFEDLIIQYQPNCIIHERLFFSPPAKNTRKKSASILNTNMITGSIWYIAGKHNVDVYQYSPQTVKKTLTGNGRAEKDTIIKQIESMFNVECLKTHKEHICDAISIGLTHINKTNNGDDAEEEV